ncbi:MAG TPA: (d)CMP kinase [Firmicutes bacterium]|nr:(d)CMP kinase [Bacillota bacterium]
MTKRGIVVAIDGPAGAGKSTVAKAVAKRLRYVHIDTGAMYRALTFKLLQAGVDISVEERVEQAIADYRIDMMAEGDTFRVLVNDEDVTGHLRDAAVTAAVATVSGYRAVRELLFTEQRRLARQGGVVMDGRDIGTVVFPQAEVKIFLTAQLEERARRRQIELADRGILRDRTNIVQEIAARDEADRRRPVSPLVQAPDAVLIDTTALSLDAVIERVLALCQSRMPE